MKKSLLIGIIAVVVVLIIAGTSTGWFGITGQATTDQKLMKSGTVYRMEAGGEKYEVDLRGIETHSGEVHIYIRNIAKDAGELITAIEGGAAVMIDPSVGSISVQVENIVSKAGASHAAVRIDAV